MFRLFYLSFVIFLSLQANAIPFAETRELFENDAQNREAHSLVEELEWLLKEMINMLDDMVSGIENDSSLLQNMNFRRILVNILTRVDKILEHFEQVHPALLRDSKLHHELKRIDCVRIRLSNYLAGTKRFDDTNCRALKIDVKTTLAPIKNDQQEMIHLITKIFDVLGKVNSNLETLIHLQRKNNGVSNIHSSNTIPINWEQKLQNPSTRPPMEAATVPGSPSDWNSLINQIMIGTARPQFEGVITTQRPIVNTRTTRRRGVHWEDDIANVINQWVNSMSRPRSFGV